ncbi:unnamed protein product [Ambrosiozyma monospora]|uniref:Unnamed protein product n=1 Tax=Ambrosiozyma monospora TaxID=43982 RepID=A0ACB5T039_AMBMO|nr:unnamed protein product [Ambrosiozyma monospora]
MAKITTKHKVKKKPPAGFSKIEPTLTKLQKKLKEAQSKPININRPKHESYWEIHQLNHTKSKYIYDLYYKKKLISKELYDWLLQNKFADRELIAKWKKQGYEQLCCLKCIQVKENNQGTTCVCRVPKAAFSKSAQDGDQGEEAKMGKEKDIRCVNCGCRGCASTD